MRISCETAERWPHPQPFAPYGNAERHIVLAQRGIIGELCFSPLTPGSYDGHSQYIFPLILSAMGSIKIDLGEVVKNLRLEAGFSQEQLAERCGLNRAYIGIIERGEKAITVETAARLAEGLGVKLSAIFERVEELNLDRRETLLCGQS